MYGWFIDPLESPFSFSAPIFRSSLSVLFTSITSFHPPFVRYLQKNTYRLTSRPAGVTNSDRILRFGWSVSTGIQSSQRLDFIPIVQLNALVGRKSAEDGSSEGSGVGGFEVHGWVERVHADDDFEAGHFGGVLEE